MTYFSIYIFAVASRKQLVITIVLLGVINGNNDNNNGNNDSTPGGN